MQTYPQGERSARAAQRGRSRWCRIGTPVTPHSGRGTASSPVVVIHDHRERCETPGRTVGSTWHHRDGAEKFPGAVDGARKFRTPSPR